MDAIGTGREGRSAELDVVVLTDRQDRPARGVGHGDRGQPIVGTRRQVDDDPIDSGERRVQRRQRTQRQRVGTGTTHEVCQSGGPDQVIGQDRDAHGQSSVSAR